MSSYTEGQVHQLANALEKAGFTADDLTKLGQRKGLSEIQAIIRGYGEVVIRDFFRLTEPELTIEIPALPRPTLKELREFDIREIESDTSPEGPVTLRLATILLPHETRIGGKTYKSRIAVKRGQGLVLGCQQAKWLWENQKQFPALMALLGKICIDFSGLIVVRESGGRSTPCFDDWDSENWGVFWYCVDSNFGKIGRIAIYSPDQSVRVGK